MRPGPPPFQPFCLSLVNNEDSLNFARLHDTEEDGAAEISINELKEVKLKKWKEIILDSDLLNKTVGHCINEKHVMNHDNNEIFTNEEIEHLTLGRYCNHYAAGAVRPLKLTRCTSD